MTANGKTNALMHNFITKHNHYTKASVHSSDHSSNHSSGHSSV